ncbi:LysE family transporter [Solirubrobacter soli]|uniref:LysE family transporter n=1 Tax=Solirubrobacter soli TaxID=363832 RepID=UPI00042190D9|nr:LysE family transporter [Solirubrobacter soli]
MHALTIGFGLGFLVALQLGPMSLFLVRSTLRSGLAVGLAIGGGIALVDALYAALGAAGAASLLAIDALRTTFTLLGAAVLLVLGIRTLRDAFRVRPDAETREVVRSPRRAFATAVAATASNPATIASWAAIFAAASGASANGTPALLVAGVGAGSLCWVTLLAAGTATARRAVGAKAIRIADVIAGGGLVIFGCALAISAN